MTDDEIDRLTIGEVRAIVERASAAIEAFRAVQASLGVAPAAAYASNPRPDQVAYLNDPVRVAERQRLLELNRQRPEDFPDDIASAMRRG